MWISNHCATREVPSIFHFGKKKKKAKWHLRILQHSENFMQILRVSVCVIHVCFMYILTDGIFLIYANTAHKALLQVFKRHIVYLL